MKKIKMLFRPKVILWVGISLIVLMCLFPPMIRHHADFLCIYSSDFNTHGGTIDLVRLIIQCFIVGIITGALLYTLNDKKAEGGGK